MLKMSSRYIQLIYNNGVIFPTLILYVTIFENNGWSLSLLKPNYLLLNLKHFDFKQLIPVSKILRTDFKMSSKPQNHEHKMTV